MEHEMKFREFDAESEAGENLRVTEFHAFDPAVVYSRGERRFRLANGQEVMHIGGEHYRVVETGNILHEKP